MQMLGNFGAKQNFYFIFAALLSSKKRSLANVLLRLLIHSLSVLTLTNETTRQ